MRIFTLLVANLLFFSAVHADQEILKFGVLTTLTGAPADWGENTQRGVQLALDEINKEGGIKGKKVEALYGDFLTTDLAKAASAAQRLIQVDKVNVLFTQWSEDTGIAWPIASKNNVVTVTYAAGAKDITKNKKLLFRVWPSDDTLIRKVVNYVASKTKENPCIISEQIAYFENMKEAGEDEWLKITGKKPFIVEHAPSVTDVHQYVLPLKKCASILTLSSTAIQPSVLREIRLLGTNPIILAQPSVAVPAVRTAAGAAINGVFYAAYPYQTPKFLELFKAKYDTEPGRPAASAYDAVKLVALAMTNVGTSTEEIIKGLKEVHDYSGASGKISFTVDGDRTPLDSELWRIGEEKDERVEG